MFSVFGGFLASPRPSFTGTSKFERNSNFGRGANYGVASFGIKSRSHSPLGASFARLDPHEVRGVHLPGRLRRLAAAIARRLVGDARMMRAIGQAGEGLAAAEEEFRTGGIADRPVTGGLVELQLRQSLAHRH